VKRTTERRGEREVREHVDELLLGDAVLDGVRELKSICSVSAFPAVTHPRLDRVTCGS